MAMRHRFTWLTWLLITAVGAAVLSLGLSFESHSDSSVVAKVRQFHSPAALSPGHKQIGMQCSACHGDKPMAGKSAMQEKCVACHTRNDDNKVENTHPRAKFEDPANADRLEKIDALSCVTCHSEHKPSAQNHVGLTIAKDFCIACHADVEKDAPSHKRMDFNTCTAAGCHSYHDNRNTYLKFLVRGEKKGVPEKWELPEKVFTVKPAKYGVTENPHGKGNKVGECKTCHATETRQFEAGKHGVRESIGLLPMSPKLSKLPFKPDAHSKSLSCTSCHKPDKPDVEFAAVKACMSCHDDSHTNAYEKSKHAQLWRKEVSGEGKPGTGVSCATCHMPRIKLKTPEGKRRMVVDHDNTGNLRPSIKQTKVCLNCHSLQFTHNSLADKALAQGNFIGEPSVHVESIEMALERKKSKSSQN
jgi:predicted CXXCH cytochrome family protein